jgi:hypothetical protein
VTIGTRSVLFGAHCFLLHPWFVAAAWWQLYGFPWDPRLWVAFAVHDLGYFGKPNMDGPEGETHPLLGARIMGALFDWRIAQSVVTLHDWKIQPHPENFARWGQFALLHSRYFAKSLGLPPSRLCVADKLAIALTPAWLYLPLVRGTGEIAEYMAHAQHRLVGNENVSAEERARLTSGDQRAWYRGVQDYCRRWAHAHRDDQHDTWTSDARNRATVGSDGVWK